MADLKAWGTKLKEFRTRTGLSLDLMLDEISEFNHSLSDAEKAALRAFGIEAFLSVSRTALSNYENGLLHPQSRERVALLIYFFAQKGVIQSEEASDWLEVMDWKGLSKEEKPFLFSGRTEESGVVRHASPSSKRQKLLNAFLIPEHDLPDNIKGYSIVREPGRGLIITLIVVCLLTVVVIGLLRDPAIMETLQRLKDWLVLPTATPQQERQTPLPTYSPAATQAMTDTLTPPASAEEYQKRGLAHVQQKQLDAAIADFTEAIRLKPDDADAYFSRGITFSGQGKIDQAMADFTEVIRLRPTDHLAYYQRGLLYRIRQEPERALDNFNRAIALRPEFALAFRDRGQLYQFLNRLPDALMDLRHYLTLRPDAEDRGAVQQRIAEMEAMLKKEK